MISRYTRYSVDIDVRSTSPRAMAVVPSWLRLLLLLPNILGTLQLQGVAGCAPCHCCSPACESPCCPAPRGLSCGSPAPKQTVTIDPRSHPPGRPSVRRLLDLNAGAFSGAWGQQNRLSDVADRYRQIGVQRLRTHDYNTALDIGNIYPDLSVPPSLPSATNFTLADAAFSEIVDAGFTPYFRLGNSGGQQAGSDYHPDKWGSPNSTTQLHNLVDAMVLIVARYSNATRWNLPLTHVEIWNEPNEPGFWQPWPKACRGGPCNSTDNMTAHWPLFEDLFSQAARALKANFPKVKVGGPGLGISSYCTPDSVTNRSRTGGQGVHIKPFIQKLVAQNVPLDFISWHRYSNDPHIVAQCGRTIRDMMPAQWELHVTEWNLDVSGPFNTTSASAISSATWIGLQDFADLSTMYWGCCAKYPYSASGLGADGDGLALFAADAEAPWKPQALAFALWHNFSIGYQNRIDVSIAGDPLTPLFGLAGQSKSGAAVGLLLSNPTNRSVVVDVLVGPGSMALCSVSTPCVVHQIIDESGAVHITNLSDTSLALSPWAVALVHERTPRESKNESERS